MSSGWVLTNRPAPTLTGHAYSRSASGTQMIIIDAIASGEFILGGGHTMESRLTGEPGWLERSHHKDAIDPQVHENLALQSYPAEFIMAGDAADQQLQIGNAVPPLVAKAVFEALWT